MNLTPEEKQCELANTISQKMDELRLNDGDRLLMLSWVLHTELGEMASSFANLDKMYGGGIDDLTKAITLAFNSHTKTCAILVELEGEIKQKAVDSGILKSDKGDDSES